MRPTWPELTLAVLMLLAYAAGAASALLVAGLLAVWRRMKRG